MTVVKSGVMKIIRYGQYVRNGNNEDKKVWDNMYLVVVKVELVGRQSKSGVCDIIYVGDNYNYVAACNESRVDNM